MAESRPWWEDDGALEGALAERVPQLERHRLDLCAPLRASGAYLVFLCAPRLVPVLGAVIALGRLPCHIGKAQNLAERAGRYRAMDFIAPVELYIAMLATSTIGAAAHCEALLQRRYEPIFTGWGFSSQACGSRRLPRPSLADCVLGPRRWAAQPSSVDEARARLRVVSHLARLDPAGERWPALAVEDAAVPGRERGSTLGRLRSVGGKVGAPAPSRGGVSLARETPPE